MKFNKGQISEIISLFNPDLIWFDGDWEHSAEEWDAEGIRNMILKQPKSHYKWQIARIWRLCHS